jgi:Mce-associated membrane protein
MGDTGTVTDDLDAELETPTAAEQPVVPAGSASSTPPRKGGGGGKKKKARRRRRRRQLIVLGTVGAVLIAGLAAVSIVLGLKLADRNSENQLRSSATNAARQYALDFSTYDYRHLDQDFAKVSAHLAPSFRQQYASTTASLKSIVVQYRGVATASVQGVGVSSVSSKKAVVLVFLDQQVTNSTTKTPRIDRNRLEVTLQRSGGQWQLSDLQLK